MQGDTSRSSSLKAAAARVNPRRRAVPAASCAALVVSARCE